MIVELSIVEEENVKSLLKVIQNYKINKMNIKHFYIISKNLLLKFLIKEKIIKEDELSEFCYIKNFLVNLKKLSKEKQKELLSENIIEIIYEKNEEKTSDKRLNESKNIENNDKEKKDQIKDFKETIDEDNNDKNNNIKNTNSIIFKEIFYKSIYYSNKISYIYYKEKNIGFGLFDDNFENHYIFIKNDKNNLKGEIYKNWTKFYPFDNDLKEKEKKNKKNELTKINGFIEKILKNYLKSTPTFEISGNSPFVYIKLMLLNAIKTNKTSYKIRIIGNVSEISKETGSFIYIIKDSKHISILLRDKDDIISFDSSTAHINLLKKQENIKKFKSFSYKLQNSGTCSYYAFTILDLILDSDANLIKEEFDNGILLIKIIERMSDFFISLNNKKVISKNQKELNAFNNNFSFNHNNSIFYIDDNYYLNKFIKIKSLMLNLNKTPIQDEQKEWKINVINRFIKGQYDIYYNYNKFINFIEEIKKNKIEKAILINYANEFFDKILENSKEEILNIKELKEYCEKVLDKKVFSRNILEDNEINLEIIGKDSNLEFKVFEMIVYNNLDNLKDILKFYDDNHNNIMFLLYLGNLFNEFCFDNNIKIKFQEEAESF
jgi:hypothetical protein